MKRIVVSIFIVLGAFAIILPFIASVETIANVNSSATLLSALASLITLTIAILLYEKLGIEESILQKNAEVVFDFLVKMKSKRILILSDRFALFIPMSNPLLVDNEPHYSEKLLFSNEYYTWMSDLSELANNPFMPTQIVNNYNKLLFSALSFDTSEERVNKMAKVCIIGCSAEKSKWGQIVDYECTLIDFLNNLNDLITATEEWINANSSLKTKLNL